MLEEIFPVKDKSIFANSPICLIRVRTVALLCFDRNHSHYSVNRRYQIQSFNLSKTCSGRYDHSLSLMISVSVSLFLLLCNLVVTTRTNEKILKLFVMKIGQKVRFKAKFQCKITVYDGNYQSW